jgi:hypothetical protein
MADEQLPEEVRKYMSELGKRAAKINLKKGSEYFKWVSSHKKKKAKPAEKEVV